MAITVDGTGEPASVTLTLSPGSEPFPSSVTFEALNGNGDVGTGAAQVAAGDHGHAASTVPVTLTATSYTASTADVEAHLTGINTALGSVGGGHDAVTVTDSSSIDFTLTGQALTAAVLPAGVNHDALSGFVANEHIDWTTDQGATNLHAGNIPDLSATYSVAAHNHTGIYEPADADIAKRDVAGTWTATQAFTTITGSAVTVSSPGAAQSVALDGRCHVIELADGINTEITGLPGAGFSNCLVRIKQPAVGSGTISWAAGHRFMGGSELNTASDSFSDFMLDSHDGSTVLYRGVGEGSGGGVG